MSLTPQEIFDLRTEIIHSGRWQELAVHYAADAQVRMPFALPHPVHLEGRAAIEAHLALADGAPLEFRVENVVLHQTLDPEVLIAEYDYRARATHTGHEFRIANIQLFRVRDGEIVETRDYHNHHVLGEELRRPATA
ncbi:ketosteroid isomerase-like protein [Allocatelliglobosispora scoriae]|uniref:Ketosteroid isomerase-like protein n=1 Tax=Allocatelliglobosispora scoriae TaxID=643052 RepID=A0A841C417_9ACTN|nr:nuclear transport factor 2 family protein [Allocatelliglobosispora scoriae]MBB5873571.1 ketosteroid isomerase-like protein [Allocatelliglobosispora scoriae]